MNMEINEQIKFFTENYNMLNREREEIVKETITIFKELLIEIRPIVDLMIKYDFSFSHPRSSKVTKLGAILGEDSKYLYVYDGALAVHRANKLVDTLEDRKTLSFEEFFNNCDLSFAFESIEFIKSFLPKFISEYSKDNEKRKEILKNHKLKDLI